jgi:sugar/nucleoside kinase (ribokinase family)
VLVVGRPTCDAIFTGLPSWPQPGRESYATGLELMAGGSFNLAAAANRLGLSVAFVGLIGNDMWSRFIREQFAAEGISTEFLQIVDRSLPAVSVALNVSGDRGFITHESEAEEAEAEILVQVLEALPRISVRHVHIHLVPWLADVAKAASGGGLTLSVDAWGFEPWLRSETIWSLIPKTDVLLLNEAEALVMTSTTDVCDALDALAQASSYVVVKRGPAGAMAAVEGTVVEVPTDPVQVVDATGAGDCFNAGFLYGKLHNLCPSECLQLGNICGRAAVQRVGGYSGGPTEEVLTREAAACGIQVDPPEEPA